MKLSITTLQSQRTDLFITMLYVYFEPVIYYCKHNLKEIYTHNSLLRNICINFLYCRYLLNINIHKTFCTCYIAHPTLKLTAGYTIELFEVNLLNYLT